jgi:hypothetical protein
MYVYLSSLSNLICLMVELYEMYVSHACTYLKHIYTLVTMWFSTLFATLRGTSYSYLCTRCYYKFMKHIFSSPVYQETKPTIPVSPSQEAKNSRSSKSDGQKQHRKDEKCRYMSEH